MRAIDSKNKKKGKHLGRRMMDGAPTLVQGGGEPTGSLALRICESTDERFDLDKGVPLRWLCPVCECCVETSFLLVFLDDSAAKGARCAGTRAAP